MTYTVTPLYAQLHRWAAAPFVWGLDDCMTRLADWCIANGHPDPMGDLRYSYDSAVSCQKATGFLTDPVGVCSRQFEGVAGLQRGNELRAGDVAVVMRRDNPRMPIGAMWTGTAWAMTGEGGVTTVAPEFVEVLAFWSVGYEA